MIIKVNQLHYYLSSSTNLYFIFYFKGETVEEGTTNFGVNKAGFVLHSAIHAARPDIKCIIHLHTPNIVAVRNLNMFYTDALLFTFLN